jgi:hypothetical protein
VKRRLVAALVLVALTCGCGGYEFLKVPRGGLKAGSRWQPGLGATTDGPPAGVTVTSKARGLDWLNKETQKKGGGKLKTALAGLFSLGLDIDASKIVSIKAEGLTHQQVVNPEKLAKGHAYLWETIEAAKVTIRIDKSLEATIQGKIDKFGKSGTAKKMGLEFKPVSLSSKEKYEVSGKDMVVAVKVASFKLGAETQTVTLQLGKDWQESDQSGPFGYVISVKKGGVDLPARKVKVILRNPQFGDSEGKSWERTLTTKGTLSQAGPVIGQKYNGAVDNIHVAGWDTQNFSCRVTLTRTTWKLKQIKSGLKTIK